MVTVYENKAGLSRRELLKRGGVGALLIISGSAVISPEHAWG
ncbi:MAG: twin-arginine translocation signal domain-containing protein, partial [Mesorhizobium sp.]